MKNGLEIVPVSRMDQVLERALIRMPEAIDWDEPLPKASPAARTTTRPDWWRTDRLDPVLT